MSVWSIRKHLLLLSMLPVLLASVCLTVYFTYAQLHQISESTSRNADNIIDYLRTSSEYAVFSGNVEELRKITDRILDDPSVVSVAIHDNSGLELFSASNAYNPVGEQTPLHIYEDRYIELQRDIVSSDTPLSDFDSSETVAGDAHVIGELRVVMTNHYSNLQKINTLVRSLIITLSILSISAIIGLTVSRRIARPVQKLTEVVRDITAGKLHTRARISAPAELGVLEDHINRMANELQVAKTDIEKRIDDFTEEFQQTLEELEIRNAQLDIARSNAQQANNAKSEFLASMSHEIRTPLSGIIGFSELLERSELPPREQEYAEIIRNSSRSLLGIIEEILDISKIESGKIEILEGECDISEVLDKVISLLSPAAMNKEIELFYSLSDDIPALIITDALRLQQILTNLIGNAIKFTSAGYVKIMVDLDQEHDGHLRFDIIDTGIGLDEKARDRLFNAFTQADSTISQQFGGTGLGLVISRKLASLLEGNIGFSSSFGEGTQFWFTIPVRLPEYESFVPFRHLSGTRMCVVGDHHATRDALVSRLSRWGAEVSACDADCHCLQTVSDTGVDAVVLSISHTELPDRYAAIAREISAADKPVAIMAVTSKNDQSLYDILIDAGARHCTPRSTSNFKMLELVCQLTGIPSITKQQTSDELDQVTDFTGLGYRALIVDDNSTNLKLASILLSRAGIDVTTADSGIRAIEIADEEDFDVIFLDIQMPELDGYATLDRIRQGRNRDTYCIALTAHMMPQEKQQALKSGFDRIIIKPLSELVINQVLLVWDDTEVEQADAEPGSMALFDIEEAMKLSGNSGKLVVEMTTLFVKQLDEYRRELVDLNAAGDTEALKRSVHSLHGASRYVAFPRLGRAIAGLEQDICSNDTESYDEQLAQLCDEVDRILELDLEAMLADLED